MPNAFKDADLLPISIGLFPSRLMENQLRPILLELLVIDGNPFLVFIHSYFFSGSRLDLDGFCLASGGFFELFRLAVQDLLEEPSPNASY